MTRRASMLTGIITSGLFAVFGGTFIASGQYWLGGALLVLALVRALVLLRSVRSLSS